MVGTPDSLSLKNTARPQRSMDYDPRKIQLVLNRADTRVGISQHDVVAVLGSEPNVFILRPRDPALGERGHLTLSSRGPSRTRPRRSMTLPGCSSRAPRQRPRRGGGRRLRRASPDPCSASEGSSRMGGPRATRHHQARGRGPDQGAVRPTSRTRSTCSSSGASAWQLTGQVIDPVGMRDRVIADIRRHLRRDRHLPRRPRLAHQRDRRRHSRLRAARAPARR